MNQNAHPAAAHDHRALSDLPPDARGVVRAVHGDADFITLLASRGLAVGAQLSVLRNSGHSPLLIMISDTCLALGRSEAAQIEVELITAGEGLAGS